MYTFFRQSLPFVSLVPRAFFETLIIITKVVVREGQKGEKVCQLGKLFENFRVPCKRFRFTFSLSFHPPLSSFLFFSLRVTWARV